MQWYEVIIPTSRGDIVFKVQGESVDDAAEHVQTFVCIGFMIRAMTI